MTFSTAAAPPVCVELLDDYLERRRRSGLPLSTGEVVTVLVAVLRDAEDGPSAAWGLTAAGRPIPCPTVTAAAIGPTLDDLAALAPPMAHGVVAEVRDAVVPRPGAERATLERRVFALGAPEPLVLGPLRPTVDDDADDGQGNGPGLLAFVDADLRTAVAAAFRDARDRWSRRPRSSTPRRLPLWGAAGASAVAVAVGVLLLTPGPSGGAPEDPVGGTVASPGAEDARRNDGGTTPAEQGTGRSSHAPAATPTQGERDGEPGAPAPPPEAREVNVQDDGSSAPDAVPGRETVPVEIRRVLEAVGACGPDLACMTRVYESPPRPADPVPLSPEDAVMSLVDDFGGLVVVRIEAEGRRQYVTLVRTEDRWLVRAAGAITDQPS